MPHIHELYDFVVSVFIVRRLPRHGPAVFLGYHNKYREWLPVGGHIEPDEDPLQALAHEVREECGLKTRLYSRAPAISHSGVKPLPAPDYLDVHRITRRHKHIALIYFARALTSRVRLDLREFREHRWFSRRELGLKRYALTRSIRFYAGKALDRLKT